MPAAGTIGVGSDTCVSVNVAACVVQLVAGHMQTPRQAVQPVCLTPGRCLLFGGNTGMADTKTTSVDQFSTSDRTLRTITTHLPEPRLAFAAVALNPREALVTGGYGVKDPATGKGPVYNSAVRINIATGTTQVIPMTARRGGHSLTTLPDGRLLLIGGNGDNPTGAEIFDPKQNHFARVASKMQHGRKDHRSVRATDGKIYVIGGTAGVTAPTAIEVFDPSTATFADTGMRLSEGREDAAVAYLPALNAICAIGGEVKGQAGEPESAAIDMIDLTRRTVFSARLATPRDEPQVIVRSVDPAQRKAFLLVLTGQRKIGSTETPLPAEAIEITLP